jgi:predicted metalloprotease with PDZ domain
MTRAAATGVALLLFGSLFGSACAPPRASQGNESRRYAYVIDPPAPGSWELRVEATFEGAPSQFFIAPEEASAYRDVVVVDRDAVAPAPRQGSGWTVPSCRTRCTVRYTVDLGVLAASCGRMDCARRVGDAVLGTADTWMLRPEPMGDALVQVHVGGANQARFVTGLRADGAGGYAMQARELGEASYGAFGSFRRADLALPGATLRVAFLGAPVRLGDAGVLEWIRKAASCETRVFGRFPVDATVFVVPVSDTDGVVFGRVMSLSGASVVLLFGSATTADSQRDDWVVVHEFFHLGTPSFVGEGHWLEEGLATYYEPILRTRCGWTSEKQLWKHFGTEMERGLRHDGDPASLEDRDDIDGTYWGGALFALLADVRIREATHNVHSLDDVIRAVLAQAGDSTHGARVADFIRIGDAVTGTDALSRIYESWAVRGENADLPALWRSLGVDRGDLRDGAPLVAVRKGIASGEKN